MNKKEMLLLDLKTRQESLRKTVERVNKTPGLYQRIENIILRNFYDVKERTELNKYFKTDNIYEKMTSKHLKNMILINSLINKTITKKVPKTKLLNSEENLIKIAGTITNFVRDSFEEKQKLLKETYLDPASDLKTKSYINNILEQYKSIPRSSLATFEACDRKRISNNLRNKFNASDAYKDCMETFYKSFYGKTGKELTKENHISSLIKSMNKTHITYKIMALNIANLLLSNINNQNEHLEKMRKMGQAAREDFICEYEITPEEDLKNNLRAHKDASKSVKKLVRSKKKKEDDIE